MVMRTLTNVELHNSFYYFLLQSELVGKTNGNYSHKCGTYHIITAKRGDRKAKEKTYDAKFRIYHDQFTYRGVVSASIKYF